MNTRVIKKCVVALSAMAMLMGCVAQAAFLTPSGVTASASYASSPVTKLTDNSGLSANNAAGTHDNDAGSATMWMSNAAIVAVADAWIIFDLGEAHDLTQAYIWQMNQNHAVNAAGVRNTRTMDIYVSADNVSYTQVGGTVTLGVEDGSNAALPAETVPLSASNVRYVKFDILTAGSGTTDEYVGLSEVRFEDNAPEPVTPGNPGFETPDQGDSAYGIPPSGGIWTFSGGSGLSGPNGPWKCDSTSPDPLGDQFAYLQGAPTSISQTLNGFEAGNSYYFSFYESYRTQMSPGNDLSVIVDEGLATESTLYSSSAVNNTTWEARQTDAFVAAKSSYTLTFRTTNPLGGDRSTIIDGVTVTGSGIQSTIQFSGLGASNITATAAWPYATVNTNLTASWLVWDTSDKGTIDLQTWTGKSGDMDAQSPGEVTGNATGLNADTQYSFRFYGENSTVPTNGWSSVATFASALSAAQKPVFTNQDASVISVTLEWTDNAATETSYILRRSDVGSGGPYTVIATLDADVTTYEDTEVLIETTYYYQLAATNEVNGSSTAFSACVTDATTPGLPPDQPRIPVAYDGKASWTRTTGVNTYDASGSDKLVVAVAGEHHFPNNPGGNVDGITYNGQTLIKAVERNPEVGNLTAVDIWYLDNPASYAGAGTIVVSFNGNSWCATAIGLSDTAEGVGETAVASSSASLTSVIPTANSMVISALGTGGAGNTASPAPQAMSPMTVIDGVVYSGNYAGLSTGYQSIASPSVETFSFNTAKTDVSTIAAVFPGVLKPPPAGTVIILR